MKLSRRGFLLGGGSALASAALVDRTLARPKPANGATSLVVEATRIEHFSVTEPARQRFGALTFRSGLDLRSPDPSFGGFSGLWRSADGQRLVSIADNAQWLSARIETQAGKLAGLTDAMLAPVLNEQGKPLARTRYYDTESLALGDGVAFIGIERKHAVMRFDWAASGINARGRLLNLPRELNEAVSDLPHNSGLEAIGIAPPRSSLAGALVAVSERSHDGEDAPTSGFILSGPQRGLFKVLRSQGYAVSDLNFLPDGDMLLLERKVSLLEGFGIRLRQVKAAAIRPGALVDGAVLFESEPSHQVDNLEGLALHQEAGRTIVTLISDNNFSRFQRTLLLEFALDADPRQSA
ncbi:esterase-like activity of phytase family protein [Microvirga flavescens]|uniref:esterase-like activity of phytase family protein n=1 Tax=Microvirga flavescens TaxID=2249811 RepID=UPI000DDAD9BA|nr:esterase-like activity of phytase family protein [Microvirga flavescens]